jgi:ubiquinone/menaquinone biosynthesis C-methylase UbiE
MIAVDRAVLREPQDGPDPSRASGSSRADSRDERSRGAATLAFDRLAPVYDSLAGGDAFLHQRRQTHAAFGRWLSPGCRVLEIGCGTGADTEFFARAGLPVVACDPSEEMLSRTKRRLSDAGVADRVGILACGLQQLPAFLDALDHAQGFDAIVSNFGALNCAESLAPLSAIANRHLRPGGAVVLGLMGRACAWEMAYFVARGRAAQAGRRRRSGVMVAVAGVDVPTFYHRTSDVHAALGREFTLDALVGIGVVVPPPYLEKRWQQVPVTFRRLAAGIDRLVSPWPGINLLGDHTLSRWVKSRNHA